MNWPPLPSSNHQCSNEPSWIHLESWHIGCLCHILVLQPQRPRMAAWSNHLQQLQPSAVRPWSPQWVSSLKLQALGLLLRKACRPTKKKDWRVHPEKHKSTTRSHWIIVSFRICIMHERQTLGQWCRFLMVSWGLRACEMFKKKPYIYSKRYTIKPLIDPSSPLSVQAVNWSNPLNLPSWLTPYSTYCLEREGGSNIAEASARSAAKGRVFRSFLPSTLPFGKEWFFR